ncbi:hypothetical protein AA0111_g10813 [Alternaria arborescens]|uniref:hypothetical protein n=1 Tax=Alternaria arborescens TaxID=156630 RepID=UPI001074C3D8|nr:hypothetical protein AA0111_g10813 [Alternaria arborescens]RYO18083.1 hypothetical protein AA0111_g10813 [Alternaria arborescens]
MKAKYGIQDEDTYNFDKTGFIMGVISTGAQGNREWVTAIQGINAMGWAIPPFIIFAGKHHLSA